MYRLIKLICVACIILVASPHLAAQQDKPADKHHTKSTTERRETLNRFTEAVRSRLPDGPRIPVRRNNYIDDYIFGKMERDKIPHAPLSSDTEFLRRVTLDLTGRLPEVEAIRKFVKDTDSEQA